MPKDNKIPAKYLCSITGQIMIDPVIAADGHTYEREAIEQWLQAHNTSPKTNTKLRHKELTDNHDKRSDILEFLDNHPELYDGDEIYLPKSWIAECAIAIKRNQSPEVQRWLDKDRRLLTLKLEGDSTALHLACDFSSPELVDTLLKTFKQRNQPVIPGTVGLKSVHLNVLLDRALNRGDLAQCELLLRLGAEVEQPEALTQNTLLQRMVIKGNPQAVSWLLEQKAALESRNCEGNTPLLLSVIHRHTNLTEFLLKMQANPQVKNSQDENPLHLASERGDVGMLRYLLQTRASALIDVQNANGDTPLHLAVKARHNSIISLLLEAGAYHKIKNEQDQTPIELARAQQKPKTANFIVQTVRRLKKVKLEETARLHQVVIEQASEIANLKTALQSQAQGFKTEISNMQTKIENLEKQLQPIVLKASISSPAALTFSPQASPRSVSIHSASAVSDVNSKDVAEFLRLVAEGEQDQAEAMLKRNPTLALVPGDITDLSKRTFTGITAFQYAVWALDWHMWTMIRKYLPDNEAKQQAEGFETGTWVRQHGVNAQYILEKLVNALQTTIDLYNTGKYTECGTAWVQQVGGAQLMLPAHVINEYCHPARSFSPCPNFKDTAVLPRTRKVDEGEWFTVQYSGGGLSETFAVYRAGRIFMGVCGVGLSWMSSFRNVARGWSVDGDCVFVLTNIRTAQREELINELKPRNVQRKAV